MSVVTGRRLRSAWLGGARFSLWSHWHHFTVIGDPSRRTSQRRGPRGPSLLDRCRRCGGVIAGRANRLGAMVVATPWRRRCLTMTPTTAAPTRHTCRARRRAVAGDDALALVEGGISTHFTRGRLGVRLVHKKQVRSPRDGPPLCRTVRSRRPARVMGWCWRRQSADEPVRVIVHFERVIATDVKLATSQRKRSVVPRDGVGRTDGVSTLCELLPVALHDASAGGSRRWPLHRWRPWPQGWPQRRIDGATFAARSPGPRFC